MALNICAPCGLKYGDKDRIIKGRVSTWHFGRCDYCGEEANVTESRDYGCPKLPEDRMIVRDE